MEKNLYNLFDGFDLIDKADLVLKFALLYKDYLNRPQTYEGFTKLNMLEMHVLTSIFRSPGITASDLAQNWNRTLSLISQITSKLKKAGLIYTTKSSKGKGFYNIYVTEEGKHLSHLHIANDINDVSNSMSYLLKYCSPEALDNFYLVLKHYIDLLLIDIKN